MDEAIFGLMSLAVIVVIYFFPALLANNKKNGVAIFALNLLLGWTFIGWVLALIWALADEPNNKIRIA